MKKFSALLVVCFMAITLGACTKQPETTTNAYPWRVVLVMKYTTTEQATAECIKPFIDYMDDITKDNTSVSHNTWFKDKTFQIELYFENFLAFLSFNDAGDFPETQYYTHEWHEKLFFYERTQTFKNPWIVYTYGARWATCSRRRNPAACDI